MTPDALFVFGVLAIVVILFASDRLRPDIVAILIIPALVLGDILPTKEAVAGFGDPLVLLIAGLFIVGEGLVRTGVANQVGLSITKLAGNSETRLLILLMLAVAGLGAFMSSTGVVAIFIPVILGITSRLNISPSRLMMPMAFAALFSGMLTLIATPPNLVINQALSLAGLHPFSFFDITPIGLIALAVGIIYMLVIGLRLLPASELSAITSGQRQTLMELAERYYLTDQLHRLRVDPNSPLIGQTIQQAQLRTRYGVTIVGIGRIEHYKELVFPALSGSAFCAADALYIIAPEKEISNICLEEHLTRLLIAESQQQSLIKELGLAEVLLPPESQIIGKTLRDANFRTQYALGVLGIRRSGKALLGNLSMEKLQFGDTLLVAGSWKNISLLQSDQRHFLVLNLPAELSDVAPAYRQAPFAIAILLIMVLAMAFGVVDNTIAVFLAALAMGLFRCVRMDEAYNSINWPTIVIIAGLLPLAKALDKTGGVTLIANSLANTVGGFPPEVMLVSIFILAALIGMFISNTATALLVAPIAIAAAQKLGVSPYPFAMTVAIAASAAFTTPVSSPVNTLVLAPGGYRFGDFMRVGTPLLIITMALTLLIVPLFFPF